jgi:putative ABC transport system permease protein
MEIRLLAGRFFDERDRPESALVAIVNETLARRYWPGESAIGKRLKGFDKRGRHDDWLTVVGVVQDTRSGGLEKEPFSQIYELQRQGSEQIGNIVVRTEPDASTIAAHARTLIHQQDRLAVVSSITTVEQLLNGQETKRRFQTWLIGMFSVLALGLAGVGVFSLMQYTVAARTHEFGIRMAVGARSAHIYRLVMGRGTRMAAAGVFAGALVSVWATRALSGMLFQVRPGDPTSFIFAGATLVCLGLAASYVPAWCATRVDPVTSLRQE